MYVRVSRWYIVKPKIHILVFLEGLVMEDVGMDIYGHLVYFTTL
jgi:hypothetical protein